MVDSCRATIDNVSGVSEAGKASGGTISFLAGEPLSKFAHFHPDLAHTPTHTHTYTHTYTHTHTRTILRALKSLHLQ